MTRVRDRSLTLRIYGQRGRNIFARKRRQKLNVKLFYAGGEVQSARLRLAKRTFLLQFAASARSMRQTHSNRAHS